MSEDAEPASAGGEEAVAAGSAVRGPFVPLVELTTTMSAETALRTIHRKLLDRIHENVDGVEQRLVGEYLHDFRVAVRRTRTALRQLKGVYPKKTASRFSAEFGWLSKLTSPARDLEVYLDSLAEYREALGNRIGDPLDPFVAFLREHEDRERSACSVGLRSQRYRTLVTEWESFLRPPADEDPRPGRASRPVDKLAAKSIRRAYRRVVKRGSTLAVSSPAPAFHKLRLDFKKLRYLLEFFGSLFEQAHVEDAVNTLRRTQDSLGKINDLRVQAEWLRAYSGPATDAVSYLESYIRDQQRGEREIFLDDFDLFLAADSDGAIDPVIRCLTTAD